MAIPQQDAAENTQANGSPLQSCKLILQDEESKNGCEDRTYEIGKRSRLYADMVHHIDEDKPIGGQKHRASKREEDQVPLLFCCQTFKISSRLIDGFASKSETDYQHQDDAKKNPVEQNIQGRIIV